jgi:hypothetical protein
MSEKPKSNVIGGLLTAAAVIGGPIAVKAIVKAHQSQPAITDSDLERNLDGNTGRRGPLTGDRAIDPPASGPSYWDLPIRNPDDRGGN